jgi:hypothetical protein
MYYDSCYLYNSADRIDHEYRYVIWSGDKDKIHVSCWDLWESKCVFVLTPEKIISKYMDDMDYTDFANGATRYTSGKADDVKYHSKRLIDILTGITN